MFSDWERTSRSSKVTINNILLRNLAINPDIELDEFRVFMWCCFFVAEGFSKGEVAIFNEVTAGQDLGMDLEQVRRAIFVLMNNDFVVVTDDGIIEIFNGKMDSDIFDENGKVLKDKSFKMIGKRKADFR